MIDELPPMFWKLHRGLPKQAPGSDASTRRALGLAGALPAPPSVLDLGCGPGRHTLVLVRQTGGRVRAVDLVPAFLDQLRASAQREGLDDRVATECASMLELDVEPGSVDLIWCEGAIYHVGFAAGLAHWRPWLAPGGVLAASELCWLTSDAPAEVQSFFEQGYPAMQTHRDNQRAIEGAGYELLGSFVLPDEDWRDGYYDLLASRIEALRAECETAEDAAVLDETAREIEVFEKRAGSYGYVFYVMRRPAGS